MGNDWKNIIRLISNGSVALLNVGIDTVFAGDKQIIT
jgi:hypothetical protein